MKHWTPRIAEAAERALAGGARTIVGLVLAPHYSRALDRAATATQLEEALAGRAELRFVESWHDEPGFVELLADRVRGTRRTSSSPRTACRRGSSTRATRTRTSCSRRRGSSPSGAGLERLVVLASRASRRPASRGSGRTSSTTSPTLHGPGRRATCSSARSGSSPTTSRSAGTSTTRRRSGPRELGLRLARIEMPNDDPAFVRRARGARPARGRAAGAGDEAGRDRGRAASRGASASTRSDAAR